jgi:uncharacterized protein (DUF433 family)
MSDRPLIPGTSIPLHEIAALVPSMSVEDILEDYPSLTKHQVEVAIASAPLTANDVSYPNRSLKRALNDLVSLGVFDEVPRESDHDFIPVERQRAEKLGLDFDPQYFDKLAALIEEAYGPLTGEYQIING